MTSQMPWVQRIEQLIEDGPVDVNWLIAEVVGLVPPGRAWRQREWHRQYGAKRKGLVPTPAGEVTDEAIRTGQRLVVREAIGKMVFKGRARYLIQDGVKYLEKQARPRRSDEEIAAANRRWWEGLREDERAEWIAKNIEARAKRGDWSSVVAKGWKTRRRKTSSEF